MSRNSSHLGGFIIFDIFRLFLFGLFWERNEEEEEEEAYEGIRRHTKAGRGGVFFPH
jgi:hypothetical protein